jgi:hypothetical protein
MCICLRTPVTDSPVRDGPYFLDVGGKRAVPDVQFVLSTSKIGLFSGTAVADYCDDNRNCARGTLPVYTVRVHCSFTVAWTTAQHRTALYWSTVL